MMTIAEAKQKGAGALTSSPSPLLDAQVLLSFVTGLDKTQLLFKKDEVLTEGQLEKFSTYIAMRKTGLPVAYITGHKEFFGYDFLVTPDVLIPKPDTEILVEQTLNSIEEKSSAGKLLSICDMCTGSGCVAVSAVKTAYRQKMFTEETLPLVVLADISSRALDIARQNVKALCPELPEETFRFVLTNLFENVQGRFDIICTNPPYVPAREAQELLRDGRSEPMLALNGDINLNGEYTGENDGLGIIRNLVPQAASHLNPSGVLLMETGEYNAEMTEWLFRQHGFRNTGIVRDLEGQLRVVCGTRGC